MATSVAGRASTIFRHAIAAGASVFDPSPEDLIREDRAR